MKAMDCRFIILVDSVVEFLSFDLIDQGMIASPVCLTLMLASALTPLRRKVEAAGGLQMSLIDDVTTNILQVFYPPR